MSSSLHSITLTQSLRGVRFAVPSASEEAISQRLQDCERAAGERGRQEGEKALSEQLLRQRAEMLQLQQGVLESLRRAIPQVVRDSEQALTALALKKSEDAFKARLLAGISKRAAETVNDEISMMGSVKLKEIDAAQMRIVEVVRRLENDGEIDLEALREAAAAA